MSMLLEATPMFLEAIPVQLEANSMQLEATSMQWCGSGAGSEPTRSNFEATSTQRVFDVGSDNSHIFERVCLSAYLVVQ